MNKPSLHGGSVWRDAKGRITRPGDLNAVTAKSSNGRMWDVRADNPVAMQQNDKLTGQQKPEKGKAL